MCDRNRLIRTIGVLGGMTWHSSAEYYRHETRSAFVEVIRGLGDLGATAVILGCTEFGLLLRADDVELPLFDTGRLHAEAAVDAALADYETA